MCKLKVSQKYLNSKSFWTGILFINVWGFQKSRSLSGERVASLVCYEYQVNIGDIEAIPHIDLEFLFASQYHQSDPSADTGRPRTQNSFYTLKDWHWKEIVDQNNDSFTKKNFTSPPAF